jgi:hypothetical protein
LILDDNEALRHWEERVVREQDYTCDSACDVSTAQEQLILQEGRIAAIADVFDALTSDWVYSSAARTLTQSCSTFFSAQADIVAVRQAYAD